MELQRHLDRLREQLAMSAEGSEEARAATQRLILGLEAAVRLMVLEVLSEAAAEITRELAPGSVELRLRGSEPELVVATPPTPGGEEPRGEGAAVALGSGEGAVSRINLRLPEHLKTLVDQAAERQGLSINAWLVRAVAAAVERGPSPTGPERRTPRGGQRFTGWGR